MCPGMINRHSRNITLNWPVHSFRLSNFLHLLDKETHEKAKPSQAKDIYYFKEEYIVYGCMGTSSFGAICVLKKNKKHTNKTKKTQTRTQSELLPTCFFEVT